MKEWSDKELDELFRKSAEEFEPKYQPGDWQDLRSRLDEADGVTGAGWLKNAAPWLAGALLLLLLVGVGIYYSGTGIGTEPTATGESTSASEEVKVPSQAESVMQSGARTARSQTEVLPAPNTDNQENIKSDLLDSDINDDRVAKPLAATGPEGSDRSAASGISRKTKELPRSPANVSGVRKPTTPTRESGDGAIFSTRKASNNGNTESGNSQTPAVAGRQTPPAPTEKRALDTPPSTSTTSSVVNSATSERENAPTENTVSNEAAFDNSLRRASTRMAKASPRPFLLTESTLPYPEIAYTRPALATDLSPVRPEVDIPKWSIRLGIAPDLSMAGTSEMMSSMRVGPSASLLIDYNINDRWAIQTGVIRSLKNYMAPGGEYVWPDKWKQKLMPEPYTVDGSCQVFEVPLNLRFDISQKSRSRWFASAGVSSYKMQKENYIYNYKYNNPRNMDPWETKSGWAFLSHGNVSVGYEHRISKRLSILAEPYARIPLRGVGHGKVNLFTTGVWFSARYTPVFRKQK